MTYNLFFFLLILFGSGCKNYRQPTRPHEVMDTMSVKIICHYPDSLFQVAAFKTGQPDNDTLPAYKH
jgi:hypothetical protein